MLFEGLEFHWPFVHSFTSTQTPCWETNPSSQHINDPSILIHSACDPHGAPVLLEGFELHCPSKHSSTSIHCVSLLMFLMYPGKQQVNHPSVFIHIDWEGQGRAVFSDGFEDHCPSAHSFKSVQELSFEISLTYPVKQH